jgi:Flp pilus assembly protein TadD
MILDALLEGTLTMLEAAHENGVPIDRGETANHFTRGKQALELWLDLRKAGVDQAQGLVWRGRMHRVNGESDKALADLRKSVELHPESYPARNHLSSAAFHDAPAEAARHLDWLHRRYPDDRGVRLSLAIALRQLGKLEEAAAHLDALMALDPDHPPYLLERGSVAVNAGQLDNGERFLRRALAKAPDDPNVYMMLSGCLRNAGRDAEAQSYFDRGKKVADERKRKQAEAAVKLGASTK